ncbi:16S rRNA (adenine(1518)-N(6)/adenine(1519)-N(6))-dimethyltransferase RsmA [Altericista sp. CCNU0014]|uniref:16S rRNA (adenine(1518)-N(6)/adenine(1519)-N(6))- dimethyltransferase RsmA n=1 Tax=Altericista sp. CCNU0014 TaxID=3082949 RepID=UPI00384D1A3B
MAHPRKQFGQHWLRSEKALHSIVKAADLQEGDRVLEIGPGTGALTEFLLQTPASVTAIEIDRDLCPKLVARFGKNERFLLLQGDILEMDLGAFLPPASYPNKVVANIPYNITGPILDRVLGTIAQPTNPPFNSLVLLVQKEVAQRITAKPGSRIYGALSVHCQYLAECDWICDVVAKSFFPPPKVDSAVVRLRPRPYPDPAEQPQWFSTLVRLGFQSRRKMLRNNFKSIVEPDRLTVILEEIDVNPQARAEELGVADWVALSRRLTPAAAS